MKKFFMVLGGIFAVLIVVAGVGFFLLNRAGTALDEESKAYVDATLPLIVADWDSSAVIERASPELTQVAPAEKIRELFAVFAERLGPLREYKGSSGQSNILVGKEGKTITGDYEAEAVFAEGVASIQFRVIKHGDQWRILQFRVNSDALLR